MRNLASDIALHLYWEYYKRTPGRRKKDVVDELSAVMGVSKDSVEMRMCNISYVLAEEGLAYIHGWTPLAGYEGPRERLRRIILADVISGHGTHGQGDGLGHGQARRPLRAAHHRAE